LAHHAPSILKHPVPSSTFKKGNSVDRAFTRPVLGFPPRYVEYRNFQTPFKKEWCHSKTAPR
jgi:hypothetical protein